MIKKVFKYKLIFIQLIIISCNLMISSFCVASMPVNVTITGCIKNNILYSEQTDFGTHISEGRYKIRLLDKDFNNIDLNSFEGKRISISGKLMPGDSFIIIKENIHILGVCTGLNENLLLNEEKSLK